ncbi:MAG: hypothetical protein WBQ94_27420 [Terracidiphilus sp.]
MSRPAPETGSAGDSLTLTELLSSNTARLPKRYDEDIERYLAQLFNDYAEGVARLSTKGPGARAVRDEIETIRELSQGILSTLDHYLSGHTFDAFQTFDAAIGHVRHRLQNLVLPLAELLGVHQSERVLEYYGDLYRLRTGPLTQLTKRDIFHIPFEKRQLVASQRYSIPGLPSLYLASSLWIAWEELGRPDFASIHASRFEGKGDLRVLDFGWSPSLAGYFSAFGDTDGAETFGEFAKGQAIIWPLIAACSLVRRHPGTPFVPEYIIPQFLLQWVQKEKDLDGIRYFSTKIAAMDRAKNRAFNFVFPVRHKAPIGICGGLQDSFALTPPVSWPMLQSWQPEIMSAERTAPGALDLAEGFPVAYSETEFFALEHKLKGGLIAAKIDGL